MTKLLHALGSPLLLALLLPVFASTSCNLAIDKEKVTNLVSDTLQPEKAKGVTIRYSDSGTLKAIIFTPLLERFPAEKPYSLMKQGVTGYFYGSEGKIENSLKANHAISYEKEKLIIVSGDVRLTNNKNERLKTEKLHWDQKSQKIFTDQDVIISTPENIIHGTGFESNQNFSEYRIFNPKGDIKVKEDEKGN